MWFVSVDPTWESADLKTPQSWNRYAYVRNNPINRIDPDGRIDDAIGQSMIFDCQLNNCRPNWEEDKKVVKGGIVAISLVAGGYAVRGIIAGGSALYRSLQVANALRVAAAGGAALSGSTREMATQAFKMVATLPGTAAQKVQYFQSLAAQITRASSGAWNAVQQAGPNGSTVFYGKAGEALIVDAKGGVWRGQLNVAVKVVKDTVEIAWDKLKAVQ